jgi:hypothetical protein
MRSASNSAAGQVLVSGARPKSANPRHECLDGEAVVPADALEAIASDEDRQWFPVPSDHQCVGRLSQQYAPLQLARGGVDLEVGRGCVGIAKAPLKR